MWKGKWGGKGVHEWLIEVIDMTKYIHSWKCHNDIWFVYDTNIGRYIERCLKLKTMINYEGMNQKKLSLLKVRSRDSENTWFPFTFAEL
jgi:hypothetical protein